MCVYVWGEGDKQRPKVCRSVNNLLIVTHRYSNAEDSEVYIGCCDLFYNSKKFVKQGPGRPFPLHIRGIWWADKQPNIL